MEKTAPEAYCQTFVRSMKTAEGLWKAELVGKREMLGWHRTPEVAPRRGVGMGWLAARSGRQWRG